MKNRLLSLFLAAALVLPCLISCDAPDASSVGASSDRSEQNDRRNGGRNGDASAEAEPDYAWFEMPEATGELTVYAAVDWSSSIMSRAVALFRDLSPDVEVDYQIFEMDELMLKIRTEIPAGRGPDLLLFSQVELPDVYKTMTTGLFEDLNPYFAADGGIDLDAFIRPVMDEGLIGGAACSPRSTTTCRFC